MTSLIKSVARWIAWQVAEHEFEASLSPARITIFSTATDA
jgi:hypothetical protein